MLKLQKILGGVAAVVVGDFILLYIFFHTIFRFFTPGHPLGLGQGIVVGIASCIFFWIGWCMPLLFLVGLAGWFLPGGGYFVLKETWRALIIFVMITATFVAGLYIGSIGVVDPIAYKLWYVVQMMSSPLVAIIGGHTQGGGFPVYGRPSEMGQIYTSTAGLLNLLCIVNAVYMAYIRKTQDVEQ